MKKYVLVSQGIKIYETLNKSDAEFIMNKENEEWYRYYEEHEVPVDNEIFIYEEKLTVIETIYYILQMIQLYSYKLPTVKIGNLISDFREKYTRRK